MVHTVKLAFFAVINCVPSSFVGFYSDVVFLDLHTRITVNSWNCATLDDRQRQLIKENVGRELNRKKFFFNFFFH